MKKMQCEVCGSTEIKKVDGSIFECQSCGVQYSKEEVQKLLVELIGEVKIDRTEEIDNLAQRAAQFLEKGDFSKALEYYNKVLDFDPDNEEALKAIDTINAKTVSQRIKEQDEVKSRSSAVKLLKHTIAPNDGVAVFLKALKNAPDVAPDIYKEVEILSVTQGYYPFSVVDKQYSGTYDGVACYRKRVPYTDYETRTDYHNKNQDGSYKKVQVAVTKYREEIDRQKVNGSFLVDYFGVFSISQKLNGIFTSIAPDKYDAALSDDKYFDEMLGAKLQRTHFNDVILREIEKQVTDEYNAIKSALTEVRTAEQKTIGDLEIFNESSDADWERRMTDLVASKVRSKAGDNVNRVIPGDFNEDVHYRWSEKYSDKQTIYLPIQIIEYAYRGKFYIAAMMLTKASKIIHSYPCNLELKAAKNKNEKAVANIQKRNMPSGIIILYSFFAAGVLGPIAIAITEGSIDAGFFVVFSSIFTGLFGVPAIIWHILWHRKKTKELREEMLGGTEVVDNIKDKFATELTKEYVAFFNVFTDLASIESAAVAAKNVSTYSSNIASIKGRTVSASVSNDKSADVTSGSTNIKDADGQDLVDGYRYTVRMINSGSNMIEVCKILREVFGVGLAVAKEMAETSRSVVAKGLSSDATNDLATKLKLAGAVIEIEKEV